MSTNQKNSLNSNRSVQSNNKNSPRSNMNASVSKEKPVNNLDMINRDPNSLNTFVKVWSSDVLAEPDDDNVHSSDWYDIYT